MRAVEYLDLDDLLGMVRALGAGPVRDLGLLESAVARPSTTVFGDDAYPTLSLKAPALLHSIVCNHALIDGNKRLGWLATVVFLDLNRSTTDVTDDDAFSLVMDVSQGNLDVDEIATRLGVVHSPSP